MLLSKTVDPRICYLCICSGIKLILFRRIILHFPEPKTSFRDQKMGERSSSHTDQWGGRLVEASIRGRGRGLDEAPTLPPNTDIPPFHWRMAQEGGGALNEQVAHSLSSPRGRCHIPRDQTYRSIRSIVLHMIILSSPLVIRIDRVGPNVLLFSRTVISCIRSRRTIVPREREQSWQIRRALFLDRSFAMLCQGSSRSVPLWSLADLRDLTVVIHTDDSASLICSLWRRSLLSFRSQ